MPSAAHASLSHASSRSVRRSSRSLLVSTPAFGQKTGSQFMWKVEGPGGSSAYLLGSLHVLTPDFYPLSATINKAFAESKTLVEEVDIDETNDPMLMMAALSKAMLTDGRTLDQVIAPELYAEVKTARRESRLADDGDPAHEAVARRDHADGADAAGGRIQAGARRRSALLRSRQGLGHEAPGARDDGVSARSIRFAVAEAPGRSAEDDDGGSRYGSDAA